MNWIHPVAPIGADEYNARLDSLRERMGRAGIRATLLGSTESLRYFTGLKWHASERFLGALVTEEDLTYIVPGFERERVESIFHVDGKIATWQEEESSAALVSRLVGPQGLLALDDALPLFVFYALSAELGPERLVDGTRLVRDLREIKSAAEVALIQHAMNITLDIHRRVFSLLEPGIAASEVAAFIDEQHRLAGADDGSTFCIVSFGRATSLPHGVDGDQVLARGDVILVDTGCRIDGYHSDITRTYMLDDCTRDFTRAWEIEREAQQAVYDAALLGTACERLDEAARNVLARHGLGPDYDLPGLPHRAGHGLGLEIHEAPFIVRGNTRTLSPGMCFSNEPMLVFPGKFGVRLEDHIYMTADGPVWFTTPAKSPDGV